jgi:riboflavin kinase / FMN adenylyltransferase
MKFKFLVWGKVKKGNSRGMQLGFPTVNVALHKNIEDGVYISKTKFDGKMHSSLTFVGAAKTFGEKIKKVESYVLNFNRNIYDEWITVGLIKKIRGNIKFNSEKELIAQMKKDLLIAEKCFSDEQE